MPGDRTSLSLDARLVISTRVLCFEVSRRHRRTPIGPVLPTVQTGLTHRSDQSSDAALRSSSLALWINQGTQWFSGEPLETPRTWCSLHQSPLMTWLPRSPGSTLVLRLNQGTIHYFVLLFFPPCWPPGPQTNSTCLLHTWRPHQHRPFTLVLHLHQHQSSCNLHLQYLAKSQSTQYC
jgi:hypothetical protein